MVSRALVLGGGGPVGIAWETGLLAGLEERGVDLARADLIVGTSAGAMVGAQLALGRSPQSMLASQRALAEQSRRGAASGESGGPGSAPAARLQPLMQFMERLAAADEAAARQVRAEIGAFALQADTMPEAQWLATFGFLRGAEWPPKRFIATAVDAEDGSFVAWEQSAGVPLGLAVASSCTVPGVFPPVLINGRRYIDGGMRSATNADLASGFDRVVVVAVTAAMAPTNAGDRYRRSLEREVAALHDGGSQVAVIVPDAASVEAFGPNLMDGTRRAGAVEAGYAQGKLTAEVLARGWTD